MRIYNNWIATCPLCTTMSSQSALGLLNFPPTRPIDASGLIRESEMKKKRAVAERRERKVMTDEDRRRRGSREGRKQPGTMQGMTKASVMDFPNIQQQTTRWRVLSWKRGGSYVAEGTYSDWEPPCWPPW